MWPAELLSPLTGLIVVDTRCLTADAVGDHLHPYRGWWTVSQNSIEHARNHCQTRSRLRCVLRALLI